MAEQSKIAVAGATGRVGRPLVEVLEQRGHEVVPMARATGVDVVTGDGLAEALSGVESIIDRCRQLAFSGGGAGDGVLPRRDPQPE